MTTLEAIAFTLHATALGGMVCLFFFGFAVLYRSTNIAPRCTARPPNTIFNPNARGSSSCQYRGNPWSGWILWVLSLSYETMLKGIPGTGTRNNGLSGRNLKVNLDGIVLLRFNSLGLRISTVATILYVGIALPFYYFSSLKACESEYRGYCVYGNETRIAELVNGTSINGTLLNSTLTTLSSTNSTLPNATLADNGFNFISDYHQITMRSVPALSVEQFTDFLLSNNQRLYLATLYVVSFLTWIVAAYACYELEREWTVIQALRRVFFLEYDHYGERQDEIKDTVLNKIKRDHWIPHPELRDTVPPISMYSLLVGNLPSLPTEEMGDVEAAVKQNINWQMEITKSFFDHCVPNQPGFSSSVAAVTILPGADELSTAWRKWYTAAARLRRLGFIREQMESMEVSGNLGDGEYDRVYEIEKKLFQDLNLGPEQLSVYRLEVAQSAAACCPHGCNEGKVKNATLEKLKEEYDDVFDETEEALSDLKVAQRPCSLYAPGIVHYDSRAYMFIDESEEIENASEDFPFDPEKSFSLKPRTYSSPTWADVQEVVQQSEKYSERKRKCSDGSFAIPKLRDLLPQAMKKANKFWGWTMNKSKAVNPLDIAARESTFALVTFTSRQAALAARQCVIDGRGFNRWFSVEEIPVPPMADAPPCNVAACRNCCRPVTVNLNYKQKLIRRALASVLFVLLSIFYTIPLSFAANLMRPENIGKVMQIFPLLDAVSSNDRISGLLGASIYMLFFSLCPQIFKTIANSDGRATSVSQAEKNALRYFWFFMVLTPFTNTTIFTAVINTFLNDSSVLMENGITIGSHLDSYLSEIVTTIPDVICPTWINWILLRFCLIMPLNYMLQFNSFLFDFLGWRCCARMTRGGGPGGPVPYRIYVDSGMVLLCVFSLAPFSPLIALVAVAYFIVSFPILRRNLIFIYRPKYDGGGHFWPFLFEMCMICMIITQILVTLMMALKRAVGPAIIAFLPLIPIGAFHDNIKKQFRKSFEDSSLLQTSNLDGWDISAATSKEKREDFRRFLVDAHKAAYIPVCVADSLVTAEPAIVMPSQCDADYGPLSDIPEGDDEEDSAEYSTEPRAQNVSRDIEYFKLDNGSSDEANNESIADTSTVEDEEQPSNESRRNNSMLHTASQESLQMEMRTNHQVGGMVRRVMSPMMNHESKRALLEHLQSHSSRINVDSSRKKFR